MRPYLTVLKDSFHEAFASRVLWILLAVSTLVLLALAPLGLQDQRATLLRRTSVSAWPALIERFYEASQDKQQGPVKRIWDRAGDDFQTTITDSMASTEEDLPAITRTCGLLTSSAADRAHARRRKRTMLYSTCLTRL